jgi:hypothetical protein
MHLLNKIVDKVFVINLKSRPDRKERLSCLLDKEGIEYQFIEAIDGRDYPQGNLSWGAMGCLLSHNLVCTIAQASKLKSYCVFEDDIVLCKDFGKRLATIPDDYDMFYLGCTIIKDLPTERKDIWQLKEWWGSWAYIVRESAYKDYLQVRLDMNEPEDVYSSQLSTKLNVKTIISGLVGVNKDFSDVKQIVYNPVNFVRKDTFIY